MSRAITPALKWHGGKIYLAKKIVSLMVPHIHYVEPYFGGGAVLFEKDPEGVSEVANDINGDLINFWWVLQGEDSFARFHRLCEATPFSEEEYQRACLQPYAIDDDPVFAAHQFFIRCRQSLAGRMKSFASLSRNRTRRNMNEQASAWINAIDGLPQVHARMRRVVVLNHPAIEVIQQQDGENTLFYLDPTYLPGERTAPDVFEHEMTVEEHTTLLETIVNLKGKVMISGYDSELYNWFLGEWNREEFDLPNNAAGGEEKRRMTEVLWFNWSYC